MTTPSGPIIAPPSQSYVIRLSKSDIETKLTQLGPGIAQGQADAAVVQGHVTAWSGYTDAQKIAAMDDVLPMVVRLIQDVTVLGIGVNDLVGALQVLPST